MRNALLSLLVLAACSRPTADPHAAVLAKLGSPASATFSGGAAGEDGVECGYVTPAAGASPRAYVATAEGAALDDRSASFAVNVRARCSPAFATAFGSARGASAAAEMRENVAGARAR